MYNQIIRSTDYLTWESAADARFGWQYPQPVPMKQHLPRWFLDMRGDLKEYLPQGAANDHTVRYCRGMQGLMDIGYTMALPESVGGGDSHFSGGKLHPEMMHGTPWAAQGGGPWADDTCASGFDISPYVYRISILHFPWRVKLSPGWRMLFLPNLWDWNPSYNVFSGAPRPYTKKDAYRGQIGSRVQFDTELESGYNYHNVEAVVAIRRDSRIVENAVIFTMVPVFSGDCSLDQLSF